MSHTTSKFKLKTRHKEATDANFCKHNNSFFLFILKTNNIHVTETARSIVTT